MLLRVPVCNKQSERMLWTRPEAHFLLTRSLNNKTKYCAIDFRPGLSWSIVQSIFSSSKQQLTNNVPEHTCFFDQHAHWRTNGRKWICYLNNEAQDRKMTEWLNLAKTQFVPGVWKGPRTLCGTIWFWNFVLLFYYLFIYYILFNTFLSIL